MSLLIHSVNGKTHEIISESPQALAGDHVCAIAAHTFSQVTASEQKPAVVLDSLIQMDLRSGRAYEILKTLTETAPHRLSGSPGAAAAIELTTQFMNDLGFDRVHHEAGIVPRWIRGTIEEAAIVEAFLCYLVSEQGI